MLRGYKINIFNLNFSWVFALLFLSCTKVPLTGRRQLSLLSESTMIEMSLTNYRTFLAQNPASPSSDVNAQMVKKVGLSISQAVTRFMQSKGLSNRIKGYAWEFNLVNNKTVNAWCMPGGKVVVYTGLLAVTQNETSLAVVMGHEIAHAVAHHGNERMSQQLLVQMGGIGLSLALSQKPQETQDLFLNSYGVSASLGVLKYSRTHESEADKLGLVFMAMAGYNPQEAVSFWQRMAKQGGANTMQLLSTHPGDETRIKDISSFMPKAMKYYTNKN